MLQIGVPPTAEALRQLVAQRERESRTLELKAEPVADGDLRSEVVALANSAGGHLVIGVAEDRGEAAEIVGVDVPDVDGERLRIDAVLRARITPRLTAYSVEVVDVDGRQVIIISIRRSWARPHSVELKSRESLRFPARGVGGIYWMDHAEVAAAFRAGPDAAAAVRIIHRDEVARVAAQDGPARLPPGAFTVATLTPLATLDVLAPVDLTAAPPLPVLGGSGGSFGSRWNLDGIVGAGYPTEDALEGWTQLYRNGRMTMVDSSMLAPFHGELNIGSIAFAKALRRNIAAALAALFTVGATAPVVIHVTLHGVQSHRFAISEGRFARADRDVLELPAVTLEDLALPNDEHRGLRPMLEGLFQAFGIQQVPSGATLFA